MNLISIDLGTTNIKAAIYDKSLNMLTILSDPVHYDRNKDFVEFDPEYYFSRILTLIEKAAAFGKKQNGEDVAQIVLTGQAESLILLDEMNQPVYPGISWLDMRSLEECAELASHFPQETCYRVTGQPELIPTWPITKILWMKKNRPEIVRKTAHYLLLKDYIIYRLCGNFVGDHSIYCFSHYFDITAKCYWTEILDYCSVRKEQLPKLMPSGSIAGCLSDGLCIPAYGLTTHTRINIGTLDHFAGMIGTGSIKEGQVSESAGTVLSIAAMTEKPIFDAGKLPNYCGPFPDSYVLLPVCESGGFSMEWFKNEFLKDVSYQELNEALSSRMNSCPPVFLPYLTGVNPPEFDEHVSGVFFGLHAKHDKYDMALAIMQGVACMLRKNLDYMEQAGVKIEKIISTGGGAKSPVWTQIKANITGHPIEIPDNEEAPCLGAAIMGAVDEMLFSSYEEAIASCVSFKNKYMPSQNPLFEKTYHLFNQIYSALEDSFRLNSQRECS